MPTLAELRRKSRTTTLSWEVEPGVNVPVQVTYDPGKITMDSMEIPEDDPNISVTDFWKRRLLMYVTSWDILGDDGNPVPLTPEGLKPLETALVQAIINHVQIDARPNLLTTTNT